MVDVSSEASSHMPRCAGLVFFFLWAPSCEIFPHHVSVQKYLLRQATLIIVREFTFFLYAHVVFEKRHFYFHVGELYLERANRGLVSHRAIGIAGGVESFPSRRPAQVRFVPLWAISHPGPPFRVASAASPVPRLANPPPANSGKKRRKKRRFAGARRGDPPHCDARRSLARVRTNARRVRRRGASPRGFARAHPRPDAPRTRSRRALDANPARFRRRKVRGIEKRPLGKCWRASRAGPGSTGAGRSATGPGPGRRGTRATWRTLPRVRPRRGARVNDPPRRSPFRSSAFRFRVHVLSR